MKVYKRKLHHCLLKSIRTPVDPLAIRTQEGTSVSPTRGEGGESASLEAKFSSSLQRKQLGTSLSVLSCIN